MLRNLAHRLIHNSTIPAVTEALQSVKTPRFFKPSNLCDLCSRNLSYSMTRHRGEDRKQLVASMPKRDEGAAGEKSVDIDTMLLQSKDDIFPDINLPNRLFDGVPFKELPIVNIRTSKNNTILSLTDHKGLLKMIRSCGIEGFKNTRKGTNIAAQATAISFSSMMTSEGYKTVRVRVCGLGPGRISAIKGLTMGGINVISITDSTRCSENCPRPRKQRRI